jgi:hypothetical protein
MSHSFHSVRLGPEAFTEALAHDIPACSGCGGENDRAPKQRSCRKCHNAYQKQWRSDQAAMVREYKRGRPIVSRETNDAFSEAS